MFSRISKLSWNHQCCRDHVKKPFQQSNKHRWMVFKMTVFIFCLYFIILYNAASIYISGDMAIVYSNFLNEYNWCCTMNMFIYIWCLFLQGLYQIKWQALNGIFIGPCLILLTVYLIFWRGLYVTLKMIVWYFEEGGMLLWRGWCGTLKSVVWYFEEDCMIFWRGWYASLKRVVWYFKYGCAVFQMGCCDTILFQYAWLGFVLAEASIFCFRSCLYGCPLSVASSIFHDMDQLLMFRHEPVLWRGWYGTLKRVVCYF